MIKYLLIGGLVYFFFRWNTQKSIQGTINVPNNEPDEYTDYEEVE